MLKKMIDDVVSKYKCEEQGITVGPLFEQSIVLEMGESCKSCDNLIKCRNELIDKITQEFQWITQVKIY
jgi:hypothetical protein